MKTVSQAVKDFKRAEKAYEAVHIICEDIFDGLQTLDDYQKVVSLHEISVYCDMVEKAIRVNQMMGRKP